MNEIVLPNIYIFDIGLEKKQDSWLIDQGYIERTLYTYVNFPIELTCEVIIRPKAQDHWLVTQGYI
jgi:hypothetical protein